MGEHTSIFAGLDVAKNTLDLAVEPGGFVGSFAYDQAGLDELVRTLNARGVRMLVMEATGGMEVRVAAELVAARIQVAVVNPRQVRDFARSTGKRAKNDRIDAVVLARFAHAVRPEPRGIPEPEQRLLNDLTARRRQLIGMRTMELNRLQQAAAAALRKSHETLIDALNRQVDDLDGLIGDAIKASPVWRLREQLLRGVPGVGGGTARALLAEMPELGSLTRAQVAALAGLAPYDHDSGALKGRRCIFGGRAPVRNALYMAALTASRLDGPVGAMYRRLRAAGKCFKVAITAAMRKLLTILNAIVASGQPWRSTPPITP
jgi:transposase